MTLALLELDRVSVVRAGRAILDKVSLTVPDGRHTAILGPNGSGKSTLVRLIARQLYPTIDSDGRIGETRVFGQSRWDVFELRSRLGIVSPEMQADMAAQDDPLEVFDVVASSFFASRGVWRREVTHSMRLAASEALERMGVLHLVERSMATLSTGEARRVLIARSLAHRPRALLLDEPCAGLDPAARKLFLEALRRIANDGVTVILVTHHVEEILPEINHVVLMANGRVAHDGARRELLSPGILGALFGIPMALDHRGDWDWAIPL